jgi:phenylacetate-coenzyme A ligase PaaK-like adenylate-forming protein
MHLGEDFTIFELVDADGEPVAPGARSAKMYITNLYNFVQPLIRYEITDEVSLINDPCPCGCVMTRIDDVEGRSDDTFVYDSGTAIHPLVFRSRLGSDPNIIEYQVTQTVSGANVAICVRGSVDLVALGGVLERDLAGAGLTMMKVNVEIVPSLDRQQTGKLKRFIPITTR